MPFQPQTESCDVKPELERILQDVTLPVSIIYKDDDTLAHPSVSSLWGLGVFLSVFKSRPLPPPLQTFTPFWA